MKNEKRKRPLVALISLSLSSYFFLFSLFFFHLTERVIAFAGNYKGSHEDDIILGTNVINNWEITICKKEHSFRFCEKPTDDLPNKTNIYQNYFNKDGNYICVQDG